MAMGRLSILALTLGLAACASRGPILFGERVPKHCMKDSAVDDEECMGLLFDRLIRGLVQRPYDDVAVDRYVAQVGNRLARATGDHRSWKFVVLDDPGVQAFVTMGSIVYIYRGTLAVLRDEAELAAVLAHEMSHLLGGHARERWADAMRDVARSESARSQANRYARDDEIQADEHAVVLLARAGYDPRSALSLWKKMSAAESSGTPKFLSTHPAPKDRIKDIEKNLPRVLPLYAKKG